MAPGRELVPAVVRCYSRSGDELGARPAALVHIADGDVKVAPLRDV